MLNSEVKQLTQGGLSAGWLDGAGNDLTQLLLQWVRRCR